MPFAPEPAMTTATPLALPPLLRERQAELDELFALLPAPSPAEATGTWKGRLLALRGLDWLPRPLAAGLYRALALPLNPWQGKHLGEARGSNRWLRPDGIDFGHFRIRTGVSAVDGLPVLHLDYDLPENPALLRGIRGEARRLDDQRLLARMNWKGRGGLHRVLYFTLEPAGHGHVA